MKKPESYTHCFSPLHISGRLVPCGQCPACLRMNASRQVDDITGYSLDNPDEKIIFLTLTYNNENLPLAHLSFDSSDFRTIAPFNVDRFSDTVKDREDNFYMADNRIKWSLSRSSYCKKLPDSEIINEISLTGEKIITKRHNVLVPVLSHYDIQLFYKRLRKRYEKFIKEKELPNYPIRHYSVGEYGPTYFRPHYHVLLFCQNDIYKWLKSNLNSLWTFGYYYPKRSDRGTAKYVAQYVSSSASLPNYLKTTFAKPFHVRSNFLYKSMHSRERQAVTGENFNWFDGYFYENNGKTATCLYSQSYLRRLFPKPYCYDPRNRQQGFSTLQLYVQLKNYFKIDNCSKLADLFKNGHYPFANLLPEFIFTGMDKDRLLRILYTSKLFYKNALYFYPELDENSAMLQYYSNITHYYDFIEQKSLSNFYLNQELTMLRSDITDVDKKYRVGNMYIDTFPKLFISKRLRHTPGKLVTTSLIDPIFNDEIPFSEHTEYIPDKYEVEELTNYRVNDIVFNFWKEMDIDVFHDIPFYDINNTLEIINYRNEVKRSLEEDVKHKARNDYNRRYLCEEPINLKNIL